MGKKVKEDELSAWGLVIPEVVYKIRHIPTGKWVARSFSSTKPWSLVEKGGRVFTGPQYVYSMISKRGITEEWLLRHGLGSFAHYEIVPIVLVENGDYSRNLGATIEMYENSDTSLR